MIVKRRVGCGRTAQVHKAIWENGFVEVAFKELMYSKSAMENARKRRNIIKPFKEEIKLLQ